MRFLKQNDFFSQKLVLFYVYYRITNIKAGIHSRGSSRSEYEPGSVTTEDYLWLSLARTPIGFSHD